MTKAKLALCLLLVGCGEMDPARLDEAVALVWRGQYNAPADAVPPDVIVYVARCIDTKADGACVDGQYEPARHRINLGAAPSYSASALAHELYHADEWRLYGDLDAEHAGRGWSTYVPDAERALRDAGL